MMRFFCLLVAVPVFLINQLLDKISFCLNVIGRELKASNTNKSPCKISINGAGIYQKDLYNRRIGIEKTAKKGAIRNGSR